MSMRLVIQIPCFDEAENLAAVLQAVPRQIDGVDQVLVVVVDDGSSDGTAEVAARHGADLVFRHPRNRGYLSAFDTGLRAGLALGADIIVNTDGDHQYPGHHIAALIAPVLHGQADLAVGDRQPGINPHFSWLKRRLQQLGSWTVGRLAGIPVADAASGFRAYGRTAALRLYTFTDFSHTAESLIRYGQMGMTVAFVPIDTHATPRPSRLQRNMWHYVYRQAATLLRAHAFYRPLKTFLLLGAPFLGAGLVLALRFAYLYVSGQGGVARYIHSVTISGSLLLTGLLLWALGLLGDALMSNRRLAEESLFHHRRSPGGLAASWRELEPMIVHRAPSATVVPASSSTNS